MDSETLDRAIINDRYRVQKILGRGGMGRVYLVRDLLAPASEPPGPGPSRSGAGTASLADRPAPADLALKCIPVGSRFSEFVDYFKHEFRTLAKLRHPNIAEVYDFGLIEETGEYFFTSEWVDGIDLITATEAMSWEDFTSAIVQTCRGLEYIHSRGLIHYDVKPSNILVAARPAADGGGIEVKLIDFGLAEERRPGEAIDVIKGTVSYIAPEVAKSIPIDKRADLYSLGVTLYQCATRELPFVGHTNLEVIRQHIHIPPRRPRDLRPDLPEALETVILKLLEKDPGARYASANQVIRSINRITGGSFEVETKETTESYIYTGRFVGRGAEFARLEAAFAGVFGDVARTAASSAATAAAEPGGEDDSDPLLSLGSDPAKLRPRRPGELPPVVASPARPGSSTIAVPVELPGDPLAADEGGDATAETSADADAAPDAPSRLILVSGESGIGKTRLLREFKNHVQLSAVEIHEGTCSREGRAYQPFVEILRRLALGARGAADARPEDRPLPKPGTSSAAAFLSAASAARRDAVDALLERHGAYVAKLVPELAVEAGAQRAAFLDPEADRVRLLDRVSRFIVELAADRPMVLYIHDAHWADETTVELLRFLARQMRVGAELEAKLLVLVTYRPSEADSGALGRALEGLAAECPTEDLHLRPLAEADVLRLITSMLGIEGGEGKKASRDELAAHAELLARRLFEETKGNPFFIEEVMKSLLEQRLVRVVAGQWRASAADVEALSLPKGVKDVIGERLRRLGEREFEVLTWLAVIRRAATMAELEEISGTGRDEVLPLLEALERKQIVHGSTRGGLVAYELAHGLTLEAVYEQIAPERSVELHRRVADTLEAMVREGDLAEDPGELADHLERAGERARAFDYCVRAGETNRAVFALPEAIRYYQRALALLDAVAVEPRRRWGIAERLAEVYLLTGEYDRALGLFETILGADDESSGPELAPAARARINRNVGAIHERRGAYDAALDAYRSCIGSVAGSQEDANLRAATASVLLKTADLPDQDRYSEARRWAESARDIVQAYPETPDVARIYEILGLTHGRSGEFRKAEANFQKSHDIHARSGNSAGIAGSLCLLGSLAADRGDLAAATRRYDRALEIAEAIGHVQGVAETAGLLGDVHHAAGNYKRSRQLHGKSLAIRKRIDDREGIVRSLNRLGVLYHDLGQHDLAIHQLEESRRLCAGMEDRDELASALTQLGRIYTTVGAFDQAEDHASDALGEAMLLDPRGADAEKSATALKAHCYFTLGALRGAQGQIDEAEPYLLRALTIFERAGARYEAAKVQLEIAELLLDGGGADRARAVIDAAAAKVAELGLHKLEVAHLLVRGRLRTETDPAGALEDLQGAQDGARRLEKPELEWRAAAGAAVCFERLGALERAAAACVDALEILKRLHAQLPAALKAVYLRHPGRRAVSERFKELRARLLEAAS